MLLCKILVSTIHQKMKNKKVIQQNNFEISA